jgi:uncharacterized protein
MTDVTVTNNPDQSRYEARLDGELAGIAEYQLTERLIVFTHTQVEPEFEGKGVGTVLARQALDDVRATDVRKVVAKCPFIKSWIEKHPDYQDLLRTR